MKKVSIIVPVYNVEKYLDECIESILNQSYENIELILVDDGSTDSSSEICDSYSIYEKVVVLHKKNEGLSSARNYGIEYATGDYISFIDSDDYIHTKFLEILVDSIENSDCDISICRMTRSEPELGNGSGKINIYQNKQILTYILYQKDQMLFSVAACNKLYKKKIFNNIRYPIGKLNEDMFIICEIMGGVKNIAVCDFSGYYYRINPASITQSSFTHKSMDVVSACEHIVAYVANRYGNYKKINNAAKNIAFRRNFQMLNKLWNSDNLERYIEDEKILKNNLRIYKKGIILDFHSRLSSKITAISLMFGFEFTKKLLSFTKK